MFGYVGEVVFPTLVLGQLVDALDQALITAPEDSSAIRHATFVDLIKHSFGQRDNVPKYDFSILHASRDGSGMAATFVVWQLSYSARTDSWSDTRIPVPEDRSDIVVALGSGQEAATTFGKTMATTPQGRTSRSAFWAFCDTLKSNKDPLTGGAPQLVGMYRTMAPKTFGIYYQGQRFFEGLGLPDGRTYGSIEWRDENFQLIDGDTLDLLPGAQRHARDRTKP